MTVHCPTMNLSIKPGLTLNRRSAGRFPVRSVNSAFDLASSLRYVAFIQAGYQSESFSCAA